VAGGVLLLAAGVVAGLLLTGGGSDGSGGSSSPEAGTFTATGPWRISIEDQTQGPDDDGCAVSVVDANGAEVGRIEGVYDHRTFQVAGTGVFRWTVSKAGCAVSGLQGSGEVRLPFAQQSYQGDTPAFETQGPVSVQVIDFGGSDSCDLTLRAVDGRTLDFVTVPKDSGPVTLDPGAPATVYIAEPGCGIKVSAGS
jgi:hypothetical protein